MRALVTTAAMVAGLLVIAPSANAQDQRPCVSKTEFHGLHGDNTRAQVETRWEVARLGTPAGRGAFRFFVTYPLCGHINDGSSVTVSYGNTDHQWKTALLTVVLGNDA